MIKENKTTLYVVGMPIGNSKDASSRAIEVIENSDIVIVESLRCFLLNSKALGINFDKEIIEWGPEPSKRTHTIKDIENIFNKFSKISLLVDDGLPGICDPGVDIVKAAHNNNVTVTIIPGPSIISSLIAVSGGPGRGFIFIENFSENKQKRIKQLQKLKKIDMPFVFLVSNRAEHNKIILEILKDIQDVLGSHTEGTIGIDLTMPTEIVYRNSIDNIIDFFSSKSFSKDSHFSMFVSPFMHFSYKEDYVLNDLEDDPNDFSFKVNSDQLTKRIGTGPDTIKIIKNFMSQSEINILKLYCDCLYKGIEENKKYKKEALSIIKKYKNRIKDISEKLFDVSLIDDQIGNDSHKETFNLNGRKPGFETPVHSDHIDKSINNYEWSGHISNLIYINDDYLGGELYFPEHDLKIKPESGMLISFPGNFANRHGIIRANDFRYALSLFLKIKDFS